MRTNRRRRNANSGGHGGSCSATVNDKGSERPACRGGRVGCPLQTAGGCPVRDKKHAAAVLVRVTP